MSAEIDVVDMTGLGIENQVTIEGIGIELIEEIVENLTQTNGEHPNIR